MTARPSSSGRHTLQLFVLVALALGVRLYAIVGNTPMFFAIRRAKAVDLLLFVLFLSVVVPGALAGLDWIVGRFVSLRVQRCYRCGVVFVLLAAIAMPICKLAPWVGSRVIMAAGTLIGAAATAVYFKVAAARRAVLFLWPILLISPGVLLLGSPTSRFLVRWHDPRPLAARVGSPAPVVLVVFDEFCGVSLMDRQGRIDASRFPHFAALASESYWFRNATTVSAETETSLAAILTGNYPHAGVCEPDAYEYPRNLITLLAGSYRFHVEEPVTGFCPDAWASRDEPPMHLGWRLSSLLADVVILELKILLPPDWPLRLPDVSDQWGFFAGKDDRGARPAPMSPRSRIDRFIENIQPDETPTLHFLHAMLPHRPWIYLPSGRTYTALPLGSHDYFARHATADDAIAIGMASERWADDPWAVAQAEQRYLLQLAFVDRIVGQLTDRLQQAGLYERSLIVVTADHGMSFVPGRRPRGLDEETAPELMSVPLIVKLPHQRRGSVSDRNVESIDLAATVAEVLDVELPWQTDGSSILSSGQERPTKTVVGLDGETLTTRDARFPEKAAILRRTLETFGRYPGFQGLFRIGPHHEIVGRRIAECDVAEDAAGRVELFGVEALARTDAAASWLPCHLGGRILPSEKTRLPMDLAIAVGGTVCATTRTLAIPGLKDTWAAMVPEDVWGKGRPEIEIYAVRRSGGKVGLSPLPVVHWPATP